MTCDSRSRKPFQLAMVVVLVVLLVYAFISGNYSIGALSVIPALLFVYAECRDLPFLTCKPDDASGFPLKRKS